MHIGVMSAPEIQTLIDLFLLVRKYASFRTGTDHGLNICNICAERSALQDCIDVLCRASCWKPNALNSKMKQEGTTNTGWKMRFPRHSEYPLSSGEGFGLMKRCN